VSEEIRRQQSWLELLQISGPFLTLPVAHRAFPGGPAPVPQDERARLRALVSGMLDDRGATRHAVIAAMLRGVLSWQNRLRIDGDMPDSLAEVVTEHGVVIRPDFGFYAEDAGDEPDESEGDAGEESGEDGDSGADSLGQLEAQTGGRGPWKLLGRYLPWGTHPLARITGDGWPASAVERLAVLLRARDVPVGVVTDGRWWAIVWAPRGGATGVAIWDASLFGEDPGWLRSLVELLHLRRFLAVPPPDRLPALLAESLERQEELTEALGWQVREAVEMLTATLDRVDREAGGELLRGVDDEDLYGGALTMLMRVVFLLFAEERRLLPSDDDVYDASYGVGHLVDQLAQGASLDGEQALEHRTGAWHRLLAVSRAVHGGVAHEDLRLPAYGGGLFDPDRYPWLEGRHAGEVAPAARPPAVDDRTVLRMLSAVQFVQIGGERRRVTFRALDVEQIGYVYEGLLELEARTATEVVLGLARPSAWPRVKYDCEVTLASATAHQADGTLEAWLAERTGWSAARVRAALAEPVAADRRAAISRIIGADAALVKAIAPLSAVLRHDERGLPAVTLPGGRYIARSSRRAATGTHYTPRPLAEEVASGALQPLVYRPGPLETADETRWRIRPSSEIEQLRVADIAMGSGAFLVAACRYLADRLVEAWVAEGRTKAVASARHRAAGRVGADAEADQLLLEALRRIAEHCLYGVDINPLAVEMAKLSLWLITMDRERPFGFLDDRLIAGDSLLGLTSIEQLEELHMDPVRGRQLHAQTLDIADGWRARLAQAADLRRRITASDVVTIRDVEHKARLLDEAQETSGSLAAVADAITATGLEAAKLRGKSNDGAFLNLEIRVSALDAGSGKLAAQADAVIQAGRPAGTVPRLPLHWPLAFPEVFADVAKPGFDAIIGNPPFLGGQKLSSTFGDDYLAWMQRWDGRDVRGSADLAARFVLRAERLLGSRGQLGYVTVNTLVEGATLRVGLEQVTARGLTIRRGRSGHPWPTASAHLQIVELWASRVPLDKDAASWLDGEEAPAIGPDLQPYGLLHARPERLRENEGIAFQGSNVLGLGFTLTFEQAQELIARDPRNAEVIEPYVIGKDLNQRPDSSASRMVINFRDWPLERAETYPDCMDIARRLVRPQREQSHDRQRRELWWRFTRPAPELYDAIKGYESVLAIARVSSSLTPLRVNVGPIYSEKCVIFATDNFAHLAILTSSAHTAWALRYTSTLRTDINYAPSDVFLTLPRPTPTTALAELGKELDTSRRALMLSRSWGLTTTYNHVHDPDFHDPFVTTFRDLHVAIDEAVLMAYGWGDLDLKIGHHPTKIGMRWTVSKEARFELLDRLLEENQRRYQAENP
jgi:hypothetical protein